MKLCEVTIAYKPKYADKPQISKSEDAFNLREHIFNVDTLAYQEQFAVILMNRAGRVLGYSVISTGSQNATLIDIKMIAQRAILSHASGVILMHNHPSGCLSPSPEDDRITSRIKDTLKLFDTKTLDHIIISGDIDSDEYYSYTDNGKF